MTEAEWLACRNPAAMLDHLQHQGGAGDRKLRLFACGCYRAVSRLTGRRGGRWVRTAEAFADGAASAEELARAGRAADSALEKAGGVPLGLFFAAWAAEPDLGGIGCIAYEHAGHTQPPIPHALQVGLLRCVFGNPSRPAAIGAACLTVDVLALAHAAYDERLLPEGCLDPVRLAVLADALEEAGGASADLLAHLRSPGPHVRGCWALDLVLGRG